MAILTRKDYGEALAFVAETSRAETMDRFRTAVVTGVRQLVPCDVAGYNEVGAERVLVVADPAEMMFDGVEETMARVAHEHPLIAAHQRGDRSARRISDFLSRAALRRTELYRDVYRRLGCEYQVAFGLPGETVIGVALNRGTRDFSERDLAVLETVRPHLADAYVHVRAREWARALVDALEQGLDQTGSAVLMLDSQRRVTHVGGPARELLGAYGVAPPERGGALPGSLGEWLAGQGRPNAARAHVLDGPRGRLTARLIDGAGEGSQPLLLIEDRRRGAPSAASLRALGLTRRQADVLRELCTGAGTAEIAADLALSEATVRKHLEHVYERLGVGTRAASVARAFAAPDPPD